MEPPSAVPLNNELAAARGEAAAAEDNVLWKLTGQVIDNLEDMQRALDNVSWPACVCCASSVLLAVVHLQISRGLKHDTITHCCGEYQAKECWLSSILWLGENEATVVISQ